MRLGLRTYLIVLVIVVLGLSLRLYAAQAVWIDSDEGNYFYDASMVSEGKVPFRDFLTRAPVYIYMLSGFTGTFGESLLVARGFSVIVAALSIIFVFGIGKELYGKRIGLLAAGIYALSPFVIFFDVLGATQPLQKLLIIAGMFLFVRGLKSERLGYYVLTGAFLGAAYLIRQSTAIFFLTIPIFVYAYTRSAGKAAKRSVSVYLGAVLVSLPIFGFLASAAGFEIVYEMAGLGTAFYGYTNPMGIPVMFNKIGITFLAVKELLYLIAPAVMFLAYFFLQGRRRWPGIVGGLGVLAAVLFIAADAFVFYGMGNALKTSLPLLAAFSAIILLVAAGGGRVLRSHKRMLGKNPLNMFLVFWFGSVLLFNVAFFKLHLSYFNEFSAVMCLMAGMVVASLLASEKKGVSRVFLGLLLVSAAFVPVNYYYTHGYEQYWSPSAIAEASEYIRMNTQEGEEIFTATTIVPYLAGRRVLFDITHPYIGYAVPDRTEGWLESIGYPSVAEIMEYMDSQEIRYAVLDEHTRHGYFSLNEELEEYVYSHYTLEREIENMGIYRRVS